MKKDELLDLADTIDEVEDEILRQKTLNQDPQMSEWCESRARLMSQMKSELSHYIHTKRMRIRL